MKATTKDLPVLVLMSTIDLVDSDDDSVVEVVKVEQNRCFVQKRCFAERVYYMIEFVENDERTMENKLIQWTDEGRAFAFQRYNLERLWVMLFAHIDEKGMLARHWLAVNLQELA